MKTCIIKPNGNRQYCQALQEFKSIEPPIWQLLLADYYKTDLIIDAEADDLFHNEIVEKVRDNNVKRVVILASGSHPSGFIQQRDEMIKLDVLFTGLDIKTETYSSLPIDPCKYKVNWNLIDLNKYRCSNWHSFTNDLNSTPYGVNYSSISCPHRCNFCVIKKFYGDTYKERPIEDVMRDFDELAKRGVVNVKMMDELFVSKSERVHKICDEIISRGYNFNIWAYARIDIMNDNLLKKMKQAGINWLAYGIESGNDTIRKEVLKGNFTKDKIKEVIRMTKDNDICIIGNFMFGFWEDNKDTMKETLDLAIELNCEYVNFYCITAFPETSYYDDLIKKGVELPTSWNQYAQVSKEFKPLQTKYLSGKEVLTFRDSAFQHYFRNSNYLNLIENKFGEKILHHLDRMLHQKIGRLFIND